MIFLRATLVLFFISTLAYGDVPPPPETLQKYKVEVNYSISDVLWSTTNFTQTVKKKINDGSHWAPCTIEIKTAKVQNKIISCVSQKTCFYKSTPACTIEFISQRDQTVNDLLTIKSQTELTSNSVGSHN